MTTHPHQHEHDRILELMADLVTGTIDEHDELELNEALDARPELQDQLLDMELAAASAQLAMLEPDQSVQNPASASAPSLRFAPAPGVPVVEPVSNPWRLFAGLGWSAAAVILVAFLLRMSAGPSSVTDPVVDPVVAPDSARLALLENEPDTVTLAWGDWALEEEGPEVAGVQGDVVWSDSAQKGYMRFVGLPVNDPTELQYQLWIIDAERGMEQRISGGVFNATTDGELVVEIDDTEIPVGEAAAFALTIEKPGGVWVSDMSRRVVIAAR